MESLVLLQQGSVLVMTRLGVGFNGCPLASIEFRYQSVGSIFYWKMIRLTDPTPDPPIKNPRANVSKNETKMNSVRKQDRGKPFLQWRNAFPTLKKWGNPRQGEYLTFGADRLLILMIAILSHSPPPVSSPSLPASTSFLRNS